MSVRVVVVDDQELMRRGLVMLLGTEDDMEIVGEATNGREALAVVATSAPDVVLTDARMPIMDGVSLIEEVSRAYSSIPVVMLTTFDDGDLVRRAIAAGAAGFMLNDSSTEDLVHAIRSVLEGGLVVDPRVARAALGGAPVPTGPDALAVLTRAERAVAAEVAVGATNAEIAERLVLAEGTVKNHVSALLRKLDQRDRTALALLLARYL